MYMQISRKSYWVYSCVWMYISCVKEWERKRKDGKNVQSRTFNYFLHLRSLVRQNKFLIVSIASNSGMSHGMIDRNSDVKSRGVSLVFEFSNGTQWTLSPFVLFFLFGNRRCVAVRRKRKGVAVPRKKKERIILINIRLRSSWFHKNSIIWWVHISFQLD